MKVNLFARMSLMGISLLATALSVSGANTWNAGGGGDTNIDTPANWDTLPLFDGATYVTFGTGGSTATVNTNANFIGIYLNRDANFTLANGAGALTVGASGLRAVLPTANSRTYAIAEDVTLAANQAWGITNNGAGAATVIVTGTIDDGASAYGITKSGNGILQLSGSNSYDGATVFRTGGLVRITHPSALGSTAGGTTIERGTWMELSGGITVAEPLVMSGEQVLSWNSPLRSISGTNTWTGPISTGTEDASISANYGSSFCAAGGIASSYGFRFRPAAGGRIIITNLPALIGSYGVQVHGGVGGTLVLGVTGNTWSAMETVSTVQADVTNALPAGSTLNLGTTWSWGGILDLNGNDQTIAQLTVVALTNTGVRMVTSAKPAVLTVNQGANTAIDAIFSGSASLTKKGAGTLALSGVSTNTGVMTVSGGVLKFAKPAALFNANAAYWTDSNIVVNTGGTLGLAIGGAGEFSVANVTALSALASATGGFQNNGLLGLDTANAPSGVYTYSSVIANPPYGNSLGINKINSGTLTLSAANTYSGRTVISGGKLNIADETAIGPNPGSSIADQLTFNGGTLLTTNTFTIDDANRGVTLAPAGGIFEAAAATSLSVSDVIAGAGPLTNAGPGALFLSGVNTYTGKTFLNGGKLSVAAETGLGSNPGVSTADQLTFNGGTLLGTATFTIDDANRGVTVGASGGTFEVDPSSATVTVARVIAGSGLLKKTGPGTLLLSAANSFSGVAAVSGGTLALGQVDALKNASLDMGLAGSQSLSLALTGPASFNIGTLRGTNALNLGANTLNIGVNNLAGIYFGAVSGTGGITKVGAGTFALAGANNYSGLTTVGSGVLEFATPSSLYAGNTASWTANNVVVSNGATLAFNVGGAGEFASPDLDILKEMGSAAGGFKSGSFLGLDTTHAVGGSFTYSSVIGNPAGNALGVQKRGENTLALDGANSYAGATWLTAGTLSINTFTNGSLASSLGASPSNAVNVVFNGGALRYTGPTAASDRYFTINNNISAIFDVTQPSTTQTFTRIVGNNLNGSGSIIKRGPGTLAIGYDGPGGSGGTYVTSISSFTVEQGGLIAVAGDVPQINASLQTAQGTAVTLGDGVILSLAMALSDWATGTQQTLKYVGTHATAILVNMNLQGPTNNVAANLKVFDISDGASDIDLVLNNSFGIWPDDPGSARKGLSDFRKDGGGTLKLLGTASQYRGTTTIRNGRIIVVGNVISNALSPLGTNVTAVQLGDAGTASTNVATLAVDGGSFTFARGLYVYPYTNGARAVFAALSTNSLLLSGAVTLSNTLQLASASAGTNALIAAGLISGPGGLTTTGSVVLAAGNAYTGLTTVVNGTLRLSTSNCIADASALRLLGGTFATAGFSETLGALDVDGAATLDFGSGSSVVRFAASAGQAWDGALTIRNWSGSKDGGGADQFFVGAVADGLSPAQLAKIIPPTGYKAKQLASGEVVMKPNGTLLFVK
jgi:autotransporter-associated beta strand protein